jgi:OOP family OmpA-OmpF porin
MVDRVRGRTQCNSLVHAVKSNGAIALCTVYATGAASNIKKGKHMKRLLTASLIAAAFASGAAFAQSPGVGPYVGASIGMSDYDWSSGCVGECDKTDIGFKVYGGYMFTPYIGAEVGYGAFGKAKVSVPGANGEFKSSGFSAFLTAQYPVDNWAIFGKVGFGWLDNEFEVTTGSRAANNSDSSTKLAWGLGATYMFNKNVGVRGEYEDYGYDFRGESDSITLWSVSIQYKF